MNRVTASLAVIAISLWMCPPWCIPADRGLWKRVDEGLFVGEFDPPQKQAGRESKITVVKIDPKSYSFKLLCASELGKLRRPPKAWCQDYNLISAINAGMYQKDGITNVGYMKNFDHLNNPRIANTYKAVLAFNRVESAIPPIRIIDLGCEDFQTLRDRYQTLIQGIRMISCQQENVWSQQDKAFGMAVLGIDKGGNVLFILSEAPHSGYDFINILLSLPLSIYNAMYLEGGREANLYFSAKNLQFERMGRHATDSEGDKIAIAWPVPNVIGIVKK